MSRRLLRGGLLAISLIVAAGCLATGSSGGKVVVLAIDGLDPGVIDTLMAEGKLPSFARMRQRGAYGHLTSMHPLLSPIIWTTIATGRNPADHKISHFVAKNPTTGETLPVTSQMRKVKALWNIFSQEEKSVGVVGWWATWPAERVRGTMVSDHTCYHFLLEDGAADHDDRTGVVYPATMENDVFGRVRRPASLVPEEVRRFVSVPDQELSRPFSFDDDLSHFKWALSTAFSYRDIGLDLWRTQDPDLLMVYIEGVDSSSHLFGHLHRSGNLAGELAEQSRRFGHTVERMYEFADEIVGRYLEALDGDTTLLVVSDHGFELGQLHGDPSKTRDMRRVSEQFHRLDGVIYMYGRGVREGSRLTKASILDVAPTVLALAGLPAGSDMPGVVLEQGLTTGPPLPRIASWETRGGESDLPVAAGDDSAAPVDQKVLEHLRSLGYLDAASPSGDRNLAAMHFQDGRYAEAVAAYRALIEQNPDDAALHASLAGALGALGDYDAALSELERAEQLEPVNPEIYHNRGALLERRGDKKAAIEQYRRAIRYQSEYQPSRTALIRLTGSADATANSTESERKAEAIAQQASQTARRGDYGVAMTLLDEAERLAPGSALVHQYRSNVAFLMGDKERAIAALRRALEIEPDNALYRKNLEAMTRPAPAPTADR